jgi:hypothetical protein
MAVRSQVGQQTVYDHQSSHNAIEFVIQQALAKIATMTLVKVVSVTNNGQLSPVGFCDVQPMVNQMDGAGRAVPHGVIHHVPYARMQGGTTAIIMDPKPGDIGIAGFSHRDLSAVKNSKAPANPGSNRRFSYADGLYLGGTLNGTPTQFIQFSDNGVNITTPLPLTFNAQNITLDAAGNLSVTGEVMRGKGTAVQNTLGAHRHGTGTAAAGTVVPTPNT